MSKLIKILLMLCAPALALAEQSTPTAAPNAEIEVEADADFLYLPVSPKSPARPVLIEGQNAKQIYNAPVMLASGKGEWYAPINVSEFKGQKLKIKYPSQSFAGVPTVLTSDHRFDRNFAQDPERPKFHIAVPNGLLGASSGLFKFNNKYYAYILQNAASFLYAGTFNLVLAESSDLVNWSYKQTDALQKTPAASPMSACVDSDNKSGLFPAAGGGVILAITNEKSQTVFATTENLTDITPLAEIKIDGAGMWPQLFFNEKSKLWTLVRTEFSQDRKSATAAIYVSKDLKKWKKASEAFPELGSNNAVLLSAEILGKGGEKWALVSGDGRYIAGDFDGRTFKRQTKTPLQIFAGTLNFVQAWNNAGKTLATATIAQPAGLMQTLGCKSANTLSIPWQLNFAETGDGQIQLRAEIPDEIKSHLNVPSDAAGGEMFFSSNTFVVPDAYGNYCLYSGVYRSKNADTLTFEVGSGVFGVDLLNGRFFLKRVIRDIGRWQMPLRRAAKIVPFSALVDSYSVEMRFFTGETVLMMGDAFLNPEQTIKVGGFGDLHVMKLEKQDVLRHDLQTLKKALEEIRIKRYEHLRNNAPDSPAPAQQSAPTAN